MKVPQSTTQSTLKGNKKFEIPEFSLVSIKEEEEEKKNYG
jgi:hypothetical protein